jgi:hypothetical protein
MDAPWYLHAHHSTEPSGLAAAPGGTRLGIVDDRRVTPVMGIGSVVLFIVAIFVIEAGDTPDSDASGAEVAAYLDGALGRLAVALVLWGIGTIALIWFLDGLRTHLSRASEQLGRLAFFFGFGVALLLLASFLPDAAGAFASDEVDGELEPGAAQAIGSLGDGFFFGAEVMLAGLFLVVGLASVRARALPVWVGWFSLLLAVVALIPPVGWAVVIWGFPLWILIVAALLWRQAAAPTTV